jgi:hypothetical protein
MKTLHKVLHSFMHVPKQLDEYLVVRKMLRKKVSQEYETAYTVLGIKFL